MATFGVTGFFFNPINLIYSQACDHNIEVETSIKS